MLPARWGNWSTNSRVIINNHQRRREQQPILYLSVPKEWEARSRDGGGRSPAGGRAGNRTPPSRSCLVPVAPGFLKLCTGERGLVWGWKQRWGSLRMLHPAAASFYCSEVPKIRYGEGMSLARLPNTLSRCFLFDGTWLLLWVRAGHQLRLDPSGPNSSLLHSGRHCLGVATFWGKSRCFPYFVHRAQV